MDFNFKNALATVFTVLFFLSGGCTKENVAQGKIGEPLKDFSVPIASKKSYESNVIWYYDATYRVTQKLSLAERKITRQIRSEIPNNDPRSIVSDAAGNFVLELTRGHLHIHTAQGTVLKNSIKMQGIPEQVI